MLLAGSALDHVELNVLQAGGLRNLPMNTSACRGRHSGHVDDKIPDLAVEVILVGVPIRTAVIIRIRIDEGNTSKAWCTFDSRKSDSVANHLGVVVLNYWLGHEVGPWREVDQRWGHSRAVAPLTAAVSRRDGVVDSLGVVCNSIAFGAESLNIAVDLIP